MQPVIKHLPLHDEISGLAQLDAHHCRHVPAHRDRQRYFWCGVVFGALLVMILFAVPQHGPF